MDKKCSILAASTALALYVIMKKENISQPTEKLKESDRKSEMDDSFLKDTENVLKMISDSSFISEVDVSSLNSSYPDNMTLSFNATLDTIEDIEDDLENIDTDRLTNPVINRNFWRLLDTTVGDSSYHAADMTIADTGDHDISDLQWQSPGRDTWSWSHWHGVTRHNTNTFSDYGSLEEDDDDVASDISSNNSDTGSGAFI